MGAQFSKKTDGNNNAAPLPIQSNPDPQFPADLSSYEAACQLDPDLQTFDVSLQERTSRVINTLAGGVEVRSLSFDSLREVTTCLLEMNQEVVKVILECKKDIWNTPELFNLVEEYFENSLQTLDFCTALEQCLTRVRDSQLMIHVAVQQFDQENDGGGVEEGKKKYLRTLEELKNFKAAGDPFTEEFFTLFQAVNNQQASMLHRLQLQKRKLDKRLKTLKVWRRVSNIIFVAALVSVLICSVVAAAVTAPPVVTAVAAAAAVPLGSMGKWCDSMWKGYEDAVKGQREVVQSMQIGTYITIKDLDGIRVLVNRLEVEIESLLQSADFALKEDKAVKLAIDEIKKKLNVFMETIDDLSKHADKCSQDITRARTVVLQRIIRHPTN